MNAILVTGATGNVGSHLVRELRRRGVPVRAFIRDLAKARALLGADVELAMGDVPDEAALEATLQAGAPDWLAHGLAEVHRQLRRGVAAQTTDVVRVLTGREPYSFADFARDVAAAFT